MCGIAGFCGRGEKEDLIKMTRSLAYRGPDQEGYFFDEKNGLGLGHRRLSIIDLKGGSQPMFNEDKSISAIFNGEIYNYKELKKTLGQRHRFLTDSDTEVIVHLYEESGEKFVESISGMFAIAVWDSNKQKLILARDRFGEKPVYFANFEKSFVFGSELKAILAHPASKAEIDSVSLQKYLAYEFIPAPRTIFRKIFKLPAANLLVLQKGEWTTKEYWNINSERKEISRPFSEKILLDELEKRIDSTVQKMLVSDVPLGIFLSGGIDSATIAYFAQKNSTRKIQTFSIGFQDKSYDESEFSQIAASKIGSDHHIKIFGKKDLIESIPQIYSRLDEPMADPSLIPTFLLSRFAREKVTVALGGDGGDELLMGYPTFQAEIISEIAAKIPCQLRKKLINPIINAIPSSSNYLSLDFKLKKFFNCLDFSFPVRNQLWIGAFSPEEIQKLTDKNAGEQFIFSELLDQYKRNGFSDKLHALSFIYMKFFLQDYVLTKVDRASMFNSLEVRAPFLDHELASWIFSLPKKMKIKNFQTKYILKKLMQNKIGRDLAFRKKHGFQPPISRLLKEDLKPLVEEKLGRKKIERENFFCADQVENLKREHFSGKADRRKQLWTLLVFEMWRENFYHR